MHFLLSSRGFTFTISEHQIVTFDSMQNENLSTFYSHGYLNTMHSWEDPGGRLIVFGVKY